MFLLSCFACSQIWLKYSYEWSPPQLHHKIDPKKTLLLSSSVYFSLTNFIGLLTKSFCCRGEVLIWVGSLERARVGSRGSVLEGVLDWWRTHEYGNLHLGGKKISSFLFPPFFLSFLCFWIFLIRPIKNSFFPLEHWNVEEII